jgi:hypothetical protein
MKKYSQNQIFELIQNGQEEVLFYLTDKFFQPSRRMLRQLGCLDADTPSVFGQVLVHVFREIQSNKITPTIDFENYFYTTLKDFFTKNYSSEVIQGNDEWKEDKEIIASCYSILDPQSQKILSLRYVENLTFEQIAVRMNFSNPFITEFEFNKAFEQLANISKARLMISAEV